MTVIERTFCEGEEQNMLNKIGPTTALLIAAATQAVCFVFVFLTASGDTVSAWDMYLFSGFLFAIFLVSIVALRPFWAGELNMYLACSSFVWSAGCFLGTGAIVYAAHGLCPTYNDLLNGQCGLERDGWTGLYFSVVTTTTLGYGDYRPTGTLRLFAALQAAFGYIYFAAAVGSIVNAASRGVNRSKSG